VYAQCPSATDRYADASVLPKLAAYNSFYMMGFSPLFWVIGKAIMTSGDKRKEEPGLPYGNILDEYGAFSKLERAAKVRVLQFIPTMAAQRCKDQNV